MKYKLTEDFIEVGGKKLFKIEALKDFSDVKKGDKGGFIENESNLKQNDESWVYDNSKVNDSKVNNSKVYNNSKVNNSIVNDSKVNNSKVNDSKVDNSRVNGLEIKKDTRIKTFGNLGSRNNTLTIIKELNYVATGCFYGTKERFIDAVEETHGDNEYGREYKEAIEFAFREGEQK